MEEWVDTEYMDGLLDGWTDTGYFEACEKNG